MTTLDDLSPLRRTEFAEAIARLEELLQQGARSFLIGAGCSKCAGLPLTVELTTKALASVKLDADSKLILETIKESFAGAADANIEDYLSELIDFLALAQRREERGATERTVLIGTVRFTADQLRAAATQIKVAIAEVIDCSVSIDTHRRFIRSVHRPLRPGAARSQQVDYLLLNYDTLIEDALALERLSYSDGMDGGVTGWWSPSTFDRDGLAARVLKLHGSINWTDAPDSLPHRVNGRIVADSSAAQQILIWPASTKYRETQFDPFAQLFNRARLCLQPRGNSPIALVTCGYRFGDSHINTEIDRALRGSRGHLTLLAFTSDDAPQGVLSQWLGDRATQNQVLVFANKGFFHGATKITSAENLPWWKFENITRLLEGER